jgi:hypothetical protein
LPGSAPAGSLARGCPAYAWRCAIAVGFAVIALMIAGASRAAAVHDALPATSTTAAPSVIEPASAAAPPATDAPAPAETGSAVAEPPTRAGAPGAVVPDGAGRGAGGSADAGSAGVSTDATVQPGGEEPTAAVAPTDPGADAAAADPAASLGDGHLNPAFPTDSGASPTAERSSAIADSTPADAPATASADPASVVDSGTTTPGTATIGLPPASPPAPAVAVVVVSGPASGDWPSMEQRSRALADRGAAAARLRGRQPASKSPARLRSGAAPGPAAVALQPLADAPTLGWKPAERSGAAAKPQRAKRARAAKADTGYVSGAPSAPNGHAVGTSSSAASAGGGVSSVYCALLVGFVLAVGLPLRRHRLRLVVSAPVGFSTLLERPG